MLKKFQVHRITESSYFVDTSGQGDRDEDILFWSDGAPEDQPLIGKQLDKKQLLQLQRVLAEYSQVLQNQPGHTSLAEHKIETGTAHPVRLPPYRLSQAYRSTVQREIDEMLEQDIIEPSSSEWAAPIVLVKKKDGGLHLCVDYR